MTWKVDFTSKGGAMKTTACSASRSARTANDCGRRAEGPPLIASSTDYVLQAGQHGKPALPQVDAVGLFACGDEFIEGFTLGVSTDEARPHDIYHLADLGC